VKWLTRAPGDRDFPERIEVVDIALPGVPLCELEIVPESEEGRIDLPTATYRRERKRLSRPQRLVQAIFVAAVVGAHLLGFIR